MMIPLELAPPVHQVRAAEDGTLFVVPTSRPAPRPMPFLPPLPKPATCAWCGSPLRDLVCTGCGVKL
jgi:hypothetical protein